MKEKITFTETPLTEDEAKHFAEALGTNVEDEKKSKFIDFPTRGKNKKK